MKLMKKLERRLTRWAQRGRSPARDLDVLPDDVMLVSYPRSGNTWTRFLIANLLWPDAPVSFVEVERRVPDIYMASRELLARTPRPRVLKSHEYFDPRYPRVIYIVRDPRDVAVSYYHFHRKTRLVADDYALDRYLERFLTGQLDRFGSWAENVNSWLATRGTSPGFLLLRYEDMLARPEEALDEVAGFFGLARSRAQLAQAVARSSADEMRSLERRSAGWKVTDTTRKDIPFVRAAKAGGWQDVLSPEQAGMIERAWRPLLERFGYRMPHAAGARP